MTREDDHVYDVVERLLDRGDDPLLVEAAHLLLTERKVWYSLKWAKLMKRASEKMRALQAQYDRGEEG